MKKSLRAILLATSMAFASIPLGSALAIGIPSGINLGIPDGFDLKSYAEAVVVHESNGGDYSAWNSAAKSGAAGAYQFLPAALADANFVSGNVTSGWGGVTWTPVAQGFGITSIQTFLTSHAGQDEAMKRFTALQWRNVNRVSPNAVAAIGSVVDGVRVTPGGVLAVAHFAGQGGVGHMFRHMDDFSKMPGYSRMKASNPRVFASQASARAHFVKYLKAGGKAHTGVGAPADETGGAGGTGGPSSGGLACFTSPILGGGARVSSPFGVDRTGRSSKGYHTGLDLVDSARGEMRAGMAMTVVSGPGGGTNAFKMETADGRQRVGFLHNRVVKVGVGDKVTPDQVVALMGDRGSPGAVHLHLVMQLRADVIQQAADGVGKVWASGSQGYGTKGRPESAEAVAKSGPNAYFVVNPEPYLWARLPFNANLLKDYASQGLSRPDGKTLETTCGPTVEDMANDRIASSNGGDTADGGFGSTGIGLVASDQVAIALATEEGRDAVIEYMTASLGDLESRRTSQQGDSMRALGWAGVGLATAVDTAINYGG